MFFFQQAFALIFISIAFHLVMAAPVPVPASDEGASRAPQAFAMYGRKIGGRDVKLVVLSGLHQVPLSSTYSLAGGWEGKLSQAAIVRIWKTQDTKLLDSIETSVGFLKDPDVGLLYHSEKNTLKDSDPKEYEYIIVTRDMRQNYPREGAPELARLYEWFDKDKEMDLAAATEQVRKAAIKKAEAMAEEYGIGFTLCYRHN